MDGPRGTPLRLARALLWREWREDCLFALAVVAALGAAGRWCSPPAILVAMGCGLVLGVRAYAPDSASGTGRFVAALPVSDGAVLWSRMAIRVVAVAAGMALALALGGGWQARMVAAATLYACLVGVLAGQVLDRATTAFAAGGAVLVILGQLLAPALLGPDLESIGLRVAGSLLLCLSGGAFVAVSRWIAGQR